MDEMTKKLGYSLVAFNGSRHCVRTDPQSFYDSYMKRKKLLIQGRLQAVKDGDPNVNREKLQEDVTYFKEAKENKEDVLLTISYLLNRSVQPNDKIIEEAETLISDI